VLQKFYYQYRWEMVGVGHDYVRPSSY